MNKKQKIGLFLPAPPGYSETFFRSKIKGLQENGHEVVLLVNKKGEYNLGKMVVGLNFSGGMFNRITSIVKGAMLMGFQFKNALKLFKLEKAEGNSLASAARRTLLNAPYLGLAVDWLHFGFATMAIDRELLGKTIGAKVATSFRGYDIDVFPLKNPGVYQRLWTHLDKVHSISQYLYNKGQSLGLSPEIPWARITPAINFEKFFLNRKIKRNEEALKILVVSRLHWIKGLEAVIDAMGQLKKQSIPFSLTLIGDGKEYERLKFAAYQNDVLDACHFKGSVPHESIPEVMKAHDLFIQYSYSEGFCNAVLEAKASGMLTIVSDGGALPENVAHQKTGYVVKGRNPYALSEILNQIYHLNFEVKGKLIAQSQKEVLMNFDLKKQKEAFNHFYTTS